MKLLNSNIALFGTVAAASLMAYCSAWAQPPSDQASASSIAEVVVTANKKSERLQDVAMTVNALTGAELDRTQTLDLEDLTSTVPGLNIQQGGFGNGTTIILRGLNTGTGAATVASTIDGIPLSISGPISEGASFGADFDPYDLERIEVLKGPQGTLYGASSLGGLINYVTKAPNPNAYHAGFEAGVLDIDHGGAGASGKGYVNIPLLDGTAALRLDGFYEHTPGWIKDTTIGLSNINDMSRSGGRLEFAWHPINDLAIRLTAMDQLKLSGGLDNIDANGLGVPADPTGAPHGYDFHSYLKNPSRNVSQLYALNVEYDLHWAKVQSITSYGELRQHFDIDSTTYGDLQLFGPGTTLKEDGQFGITKDTEELRLASEPGAQLFGHRIEWQFGGIITREDAAGLDHYLTVDFPSGNAVTTFFGPPEVFFTNTPSTYQETAFYGDITYHFTPKLDLEVGGRVFHDLQSYDQIQGGALYGFPITDEGRRGSHETDGTFATAARYHFSPDQMVYVRIASGYRPGGPEALIPGGQPTCGGSVTTGCLNSSFAPDRTVNYEAGVKSSFFDKTLTVDLSAFYIDWTDVQVSVTEVVCPPGTTSEAQCAAYPETENVAKAKSQGVEGGVVWTPIRGLDLSAQGSYADATLTEDGPAGSNSFKGDQLPYNSKLSGTLSADYEWQAFGDYKAFVGGSWSYIGKRYTTFNTRADQSHLPIPSYDTLAFQVGVRNGRYTLELYGKNLGDEKGITYYYPGLITPIAIPPAENVIRPRTIGLRLAADF